MNFVGNAVQVYDLACKSDAHVLITGPTGAGKTTLARKIHDNSKRKSKPFVTVNLAALHEGTIESELFGHERGSFTGAEQKRVGRFELAQGGTIFLDEIGELSPRLQARLLEFIQSKIVVPVGGNREIKLDVRIIVATHRNLELCVSQHTFREDLLHRLRILSIELQSLVAQAEDFDRLVHQSLSQICVTSEKCILEISEEVAIRLEQYSWPGNFRELRNVLEYAVLATEGPRIQLQHLPDWFLKQSQNGKSSSNLTHQYSDVRTLPVLGVAEVALGLNYTQTIEAFERDYLNRALDRFQGRVNLTARQIGLNKTTFLRRLKALGISAKTFQAQPCV